MFQNGSKGDSNKNASSVSMCEDGITRRLLTFVAGCSVQRYDLEVRSSCSSDMNYPKSYTWAHQWKENDFEYLIFHPQQDQSSENSGICLSIQTIQREESNTRRLPYEQKRNEASQKYRVHKLDTNCDEISFSDVNVRKDNVRVKQPAWSNYYTNYEQTSTRAPLSSSRHVTNEFVLTLKGDCSQVSSSANKLSFWIPYFTWKNLRVITVRQLWNGSDVKLTVFCPR